MLSVGAYCGLWMVVDVQSEPHSLPPVLISPGEDRKEIHHYGLLSNKKKYGRGGYTRPRFRRYFRGGKSVELFTLTTVIRIFSEISIPALSGRYNLE